MVAPLRLLKYTSTPLSHDSPYLQQTGQDLAFDLHIYMLKGIQVVCLQASLQNPVIAGA